MPSHTRIAPLPLLLILLISLLSVALESVAEVIPKSGHVITRGLVLGPNQKPIYAEVNQSGEFVNDIGEAVGEYENARVISGESYRGLYDHFQQFRQEHVGDGAYQGAVVMSAEGYKGRDPGRIKVPKSNWDGVGASFLELPVPRVNLSESIKSVLVRHNTTIADPRLLPPADGAILYRSAVDLRPGYLRNLSTDIKSLLIGEQGQVLYSSRHNIGYKAGFYEDDQGNLSDSIWNRGDKILGPVSGAMVQASMPYGMGADITDEAGVFRTSFYIPPCPGFSYSHSFFFESQLAYRSYNPQAPTPIGTYYFTHPYHYTCTGYHLRAPGHSLGALMAQVNAIGIHASMAIPYTPVDFYVDVVQLGGLGGLVNEGQTVPIAAETQYHYTPPPGGASAPWNLDLDNDRHYDQVIQNGDNVGVYLGGRSTVDEEGNPTAPDLIRRADNAPDLRPQGLLQRISEADFKETDLYLYRVSNGTLITKIEGMGNGYGNPKQMEIRRSDNSFHYRVRIPGERGTRNSWRHNGTRAEWQEALAVPDELSGRTFDALRPGEQIKLIAINRPSGYIGTQTATIEGADAGMLDFAIAPILMEAPNLKISAERVYSVEAGQSKDQQRNHLIGFEGSALTSDTLITLSTEWLDHDGTPLPDDLEGYTGRLAKVTSANSVEGGEVQQFGISPGKHLEVIRFNGDILGTEHLYVHVSGYPEWQSAGTGAGDGPLRYRPKNYVPFRVPILDEAATREARNRARYAREDGLSNITDVDAIYHWPYRPEMQFSVFEFLVNQLNVKTAFDSDLGRTTTQVDLNYQLDRARFEELERFGALRELLFELGYSELAAQYGLTEEATFEDIQGVLARHPEILSRLTRDDYLTLLLTDNGDSENRLYELAGVPLLSASAAPITLTRSVHQGQFNPAQSNGAGNDITDGYKVFNFAVTQPSRVDVVVLDPQRNEQATLISETGLVAGQYHFVLTYAEIEAMNLLPRQGNDFYLRIKARAVDNFGSAGSYLHEVEIPGDLHHTYRGEMLGQIIHHNVKIQTGTLSLQRSDLALKGRGPELAFSRSYSNAGSSDNDSLLGEGWNHNWGVQLRVLGWGGDLSEYHYTPEWVINSRERFLRPSELQPDDTEPTLISVSNGGLFKKQGAVWYAQRGHHGTLEATGDGYRFTSKDGTKYAFQRAGGRTPMPLSSIEDRNGNRLNITQAHYGGGAQEPLQRVTQVTDDSGRTLGFEYGEVCGKPRLFKVTATGGGVTAFHYNDKGLLIAAVRQPTAVPTDPCNEAGATAPAGASIEHYAYTPLLENDDHNLTTLTDPNGHTTEYGFHPPGGVPAAMGSFIQELADEEVAKSVTYPGAGSPPTFDYSFSNGNSNSNRRTVTDGRGNLTEYLLNFFGNPLEIREPAGKTTLMTWTIDEGKDDNLVTSRTDARGNTFTYLYDAKGNVTQETDPYNKVTTSTWEQKYSRLKSRTDRNGNTLSRSYNSANGDLLSATDGDGYTTEYSYYSSGEVKTATDPLNNTTTYTYDSQGNPATVKRPETAPSTTEYGLKGLLLSKTDPKGHTTTFEYDPLDRLIKQRDPDDRTSSFAYDAKGNKTQEVNRYGLTLDYTYDQRDRVSSVKRSGPELPGATQTFDYDANSNLIEESDWKGRPTQHGYNALNQRTSTTNRDQISKTMDYDLVGNLIEAKDYNGHLTTYVYDNLDRLTKSTRVGGMGESDRISEQGYDNEKNLRWQKNQSSAGEQLTQFEYNGRNQRKKRTDAEGGVYLWAYDGAGNLAQTLNEGEGKTQYTYDGNNRKATEQRYHTANDAYTTTYGYDDNGNLASILDPRGNRVTTEYDALNRPEQVEDQRGELTRYTYENGGLLITETDAGNIERVTRKDILERVTSKTLGDGGSLRYSYDANSNLTALTDARDYVTTTDYDNLDRPILISEAGERSIRKGYDNQGNLTLETAPYGAGEPQLATLYGYNAFNEVELITDPLAYTQHYSYDQAGNKLSYTNRRGHTTTTTYDRLNRLKQETAPAPLGYTQSFTYTPTGALKSETDRREHTTTHHYDLLDRLTSSEKGGITLITNGYDGNNNLTQVTDAENNTTNTSYTPRNRPEVITHADNSSIRHTYDAVGNLDTLIDENAKTTTYTYDGENRLQSRTNPNNETTRYTYDKNGNKTETRQPLGLKWAYAYDAHNRLKEAKDSLNHTTVYQYDARDNLSHQIDAEGKTVEYQYDDLDRRIAHIQHKSTGNLTVTYGYDKNGNRTSTLDAKGQRFSYGYDLLDRLITTTLPPTNGPYLDTTGIVYGYDGNGNLETITESKSGPSGTQTDQTTQSYDLFDRLSSTTQRGLTITTTYDNNGNRTQVNSPAGGTQYSYTPRNQVKTATTAEGSTRFKYYPDGRKKRVIHPNGTDTYYRYDDAYRTKKIITQKTADQGLISQYVYRYDSNGNRSKQQETQNGELETTVYEYDDADRLTQFTLTKSDNSSETTGYTLDGVGNRTVEVKRDGNNTLLTDRNYQYDDSHWVTKIGDNLENADIDYHYDNNGNTLQKQDNTQVTPESTRFIYDSRDQLVQTQRGPPNVETNLLGQYDYNYKGQRIRHLGSERGDVHYYYDQEAVLEEHNQNGQLLAHYRYADKLISLNDGSATQYYHQDALGSTTNLTQADGTLQVSYRLDPWGHIRDQVGSSVNRQVFTGQEHDEQTGLIYFGARYYDPDTARFITQDSYLGRESEPPSLHRYL
ncbi:MAG: RHS repeat-associated core domain-containing protein, partial [Sedimenticola sp.]